MLSIAFDRNDGFIRVRCEGLFTVEETLKARDIGAAVVQQCVAETGAVKTLMVTDGTVLTPEVAALSQETVGTIREYDGNRKALVVPSALMRVQMSRLVKGNSTRFFTSEEEAVAWLKDGTA